MGRVFLF